MHSLFTTFALLAASSPSLFAGVSAQDMPEGVIATGTMGPTNPPEPTMGTPINQTSDSRLLSINSIDDWCIFAPPAMQNISESETFEVAWCSQPRNNARVIPDGTITGLKVLKTDMYIQIMGYGNFTRINIPDGDWGGELDPHGAEGDGNPVGGNVTSNASGTDVHYEEWMQYIVTQDQHAILLSDFMNQSYQQFCLRVCTSANSTFSAAGMCEHKLDVMGCGFVMPADYDFDGTFETCDADVAYPPGVYPVGEENGTTVFSTFAQRWTGTIPGGTVITVGDTSTPAAPYMTPASSNCVSVPTISNGIPLPSLGFVDPPDAGSGAGGAGGPSRSGPAGAQQTSGGSNGDSPSAALGGKVAVDQGLLMTVAALIGTLLAVVAFH